MFLGGGTKKHAGPPNKKHSSLLVSIYLFFISALYQPKELAMKKHRERKPEFLENKSIVEARIT